MNCCEIFTFSSTSSPTSDFEWVSNYRGVVADSCDFPHGKVELIGDYEKFQCGIREGEERVRKQTKEFAERRSRQS